MDKTKKNQIDDITNKLEQGVKEVFESEKYLNFLKVMSRFHTYSFNNCLLIAMQKPDATRVAGFKSWQTNFNRNVKKGEKGIRILAPYSFKITKDVENEKGESVEAEIEIHSFRAISVFDISQTDGEELPAIVHLLDGSVEGFTDLIEKLEKVSPVGVEYKPIEGSANGYYSHDTNSIVVDADLAEMQTVKTLIHEIAHSILHNKENGSEKGADRNTMEVQAESVAFVVCNYLGIDTSDYSFGYVAGWSEGKELKELSASMEVIRKTASEIIKGLEQAS